MLRWRLLSTLDALGVCFCFCEITTKLPFRSVRSWPGPSNMQALNGMHEAIDYGNDYVNDRSRRCMIDLYLDAALLACGWNEHKPTPKMPVSESVWKRFLDL